MNTRIAQLETRLADIAGALKADRDGLALLGLGSVGKERNRLDEWSDLDFFAIVREGSKQRFLDDTGWLSAVKPVAWLFRNTADGFKILYADGIFAEMAVFEPGELRAIPFAEGKLVWAREDFDPSIAIPSCSKGRLKPLADADYALGELISCLYVGLCRFRRGETLSAWRFVQGYCIDRVLELAEIWIPSREEETGLQSDPYNRDRRAESLRPELAALFEKAIAGYRETPQAALAILEWVERRTKVNEAMKAEILALAKE